MTVVFYAAAAVAVLATLFAVMSKSAVSALLYLIVSLLSVAVIFYVLGAPFAAALEVIVYAGAIMVLFIFVVMLLNLGPHADEQERRWLSPTVWIGPGLLALVLVVEVFVLLFSSPAGWVTARIGPERIGVAVFGPYVLGVELVSLLLLAGLVGAYHLGRIDIDRHGARRGAP
jgi:NADH-quinone oxidoreductase subunit J